MNKLLIAVVLMTIIGCTSPTEKIVWCHGVGITAEHSDQIRRSRMAELEEKTKEIELGGLKYTVPDWVEYTAMDEDGSVFGYSHHPRLRQGKKWVQSEGQSTYIFNNNENTWKYSIRVH